jgi:hypothetical protein
MPAQARMNFISQSEPTTVPTVMCEHMSICKETGREENCNAEVCNILSSGGRISGATLTSALVTLVVQWLACLP